MRNLSLWDEYSREEVHGIFSPDTKFTPQAGTWGLQGMVRVPDRRNDWVFFVTYGREQGDHAFDESITYDGVLSWQSQPRLELNSEIIQDLVNFDDRIDNIYLFLRTKEGAKYAYFGKLGYLTHDTERQKPVYFQWQLLDWPPTEIFLNKTGLTLVGKPEMLKSVSTATPINVLVIEQAPLPKAKKSGVKTNEFRAKKSPDYGLIDSKNKKLGLEGELLVLEQEVGLLQDANRHDLADKVIHVSVIEGDGAGHDIKSYDTLGNPKFIEIKTTKGSSTTPFFISPNELEFSRQHPENYFLYRVYEFDPVLRTGKYFILQGDLSSQISLTPTQFKAQVGIA